MKPYKTLLFLFCILCFYFTGNWILDSYYKQIKEANLQQTELAQKKDSLRNVELDFYKIDSSILFNELDSIPVADFEYDTIDSPLYNLYELLLSNNDIHRTALALDAFSDESEIEYGLSSMARILNYGDSQLQNRGISNSFRIYMQRAFTGGGNGIQQNIKPDKTWQLMRMVDLSRQGSYGINGSYHTPPPLWTISPKSRKKEYGDISIVYSSIDTTHMNKKGEFVEILVHQDVTPSNLQMFADNKIIDSLLVETRGFGINRYGWAIPNGTNSLSLKIKMDPNHRLYAISINDTNGISVENIVYSNPPKSAFILQNRAFLRENYRLLNVKLILYNFGSDFIYTPSSLDQADSIKQQKYELYQRRLLQDITYLQTIVPMVPICIVSIPPVGIENKDNYVLNPDASIIRAIQKEIASKTACVFIDIWPIVQSRPYLFSNNYKYFSITGADFMGKVLYKSFVSDYHRYILNKQKDIWQN